MRLPQFLFIFPLGGLDKQRYASRAILEWSSPIWNSVHAGAYCHYIVWFCGCPTEIWVQLNTLDVPSTMSFNLTESPFIRAGRQYSVRVCYLLARAPCCKMLLMTPVQDLWTHTDNGTAVRNFTAGNVPPHGIVALLLKDAGDEPAGLYPACSVWFQCTDKNGTHVGG